MDLYGRLEELQGMTRLLIDDAGGCRPSSARETLILLRRRRRTVASTFVPCSRSSRRSSNSTDACSLISRRITLPAKKLQRLREIRELEILDGTVEEQEQYLQLFDEIKEVYKAAGMGFGRSLKVTFGDKGWVLFKDAMELRRRVTHPKKVEDCWIFETNIQTVMAANE